ncbi:quaternary amine ABC transporter ATP-binding protein [Helicovermis profundi]|uniref:Quaternary amine transport ATP-binding protein n=1 Tax=Helicovermis profundi TaxID=3065157 RepID=A0AAU9E7F3_9FIRM|nr:glycine betaine/L-proline ABC transporter ATP-binding protein [Clostridia bacterium S502]
MPIKLEVKNLTKVFGKNPKKILKHLSSGMNKNDILKSTGNVVGLNNVSFEVNEGEIFVIMGLSGSGKSTLIRCLNLLNKPTDGEIFVDGENIIDYNIKELRKFRQNKVSMVFQHFGLFSHRTVLENVEFGLEVKKINKDDRYKLSKDTLDSVGLTEWKDSYIHELSGGMQQRVGLARALANDPDILLMDEPFSALDPLIRSDMHIELLDIQSEVKKTMIFITHDVNEAFILGDRIAVLKDGEIIQIGTHKDFFDNPADEYIENFIKDIDKIRILKSKDIMRKLRLKGTLTMSPKLIIKEMESRDLDYTFIVDKERVLKGVVNIDDCIKAINENLEIVDVLRTDYKVVKKNSYIKDIINEALESAYPLAVLDDKGCIKGIIPRSSILKSLI